MKTEKLTIPLVIGYDEGSINAELYQLKQVCDKYTELGKQFEPLGLKFDTDTLQDVLSHGTRSSEKLFALINQEIDQSAIPAVREATKKSLQPIKDKFNSLVDAFSGIIRGHLQSKHFVVVEDGVVTITEEAKEFVKKDNEIFLDTEEQVQAWNLAKEIQQKIDELNIISRKYGLNVLATPNSNKPPLINSEGTLKPKVFAELHPKGIFRYNSFIQAIQETINDSSENIDSEEPVIPHFSQTIPGVKYNTTKR